MENLKMEIHAIMNLNTWLRAVMVPLVGLEHLVYITDEFSCPFVCAMCTKKGNFQNIVTHLASVGHRINFLKIHFPSIGHLIDVTEFQNHQLILNSLVLDLIGTIEMQLGRLMPCVVSSSLYQMDQGAIANKIRNSQHFREDSSSLLFKTLMQKVLAAKQRILQPAVAQLPPSKLQQEVPSQKNNERSRKQSPVKVKERRRSPVESPVKRRSEKRKKSPERRSCSRSRPRCDAPAQRLSLKKLCTSIDVYSRQLERKVQDIDESYVRYRKKPESHPRYIEEWNDFWLKEFYKLHGDVDPAACDFKHKWSTQWPARAMEMYQEDLLQIRVNLRKRLGLPVETADMEKFTQLQMESKVKLKEKNPMVPIHKKHQTVHVIIPRSPRKSIVDLDELSMEIRSKISKPVVEAPEVKESKKVPMSPVKPVVNLNEIIMEISEKVPSNNKEVKQATETEKVEEAPEPPPKPALHNILSFEDVILLFGNYDNLSESLRDGLVKFMNDLERTNPDEYQMLLNQNISASNEDVEVENNFGSGDVQQANGDIDNEREENNSGIKQNEAEVEEALLNEPEAPAAAIVATEIISDEAEDEDYALENSEMLRRALANSEIIEIIDSDATEIVDTEDDEVQECIDLTEE